MTDAEFQYYRCGCSAYITYERNAWGNETGEMVTPKDVLDFKQAEEATQ